MSVDFVIENVFIVDGSGNPWYRANLAVKNDKIATISQSAVKDAR